MIVAFCGPGRCGKDTAAEYWAKICSLRFKGGCSYTVLPHIAKSLEMSTREAYLSRHWNRDYWYEWCNEYRKNDPARIVRESLQHSDIICGVRDKCELQAALAEGLIDLAIWILRDVPADTTLTYSASECDIIIDNYGTIEQFHHKLTRLANALGVTTGRCAGAAANDCIEYRASVCDQSPVLAATGLQGARSDWPRGEVRGLRFPFTDGFFGG